LAGGNTFETKMIIEGSPPGVAGSVKSFGAAGA
jgi:hypothetical protein